MINYVRRFSSKLFTPLAIGTVAGCALLLTLAIGAGCASEATHFDALAFNLKTNYVDRVVYSTNVVTQTNTVPVEKEVVVFHTNEVGVIVPTFSNVVTVTEQIVYKTNQVAVGTNSVPVVLTDGPSDAATAAAQTAGAIGSAFGVPFIGSAILAALGMFGTWRNNRIAKANGMAASTATATAETFSQIIEVGREVLSSKYGQQAADVWKNWMVSHQVEQGVIQHASELVQDAVDNPAAKQTAKELLALMAQVQVAPSPIAPSPSQPIARA